MPLRFDDSATRSATIKSSSVSTGRPLVAPTTLPMRIDLPTFGRPGEHDVLLLGIDEHVLNALQAGQEAHGIRQSVCSAARAAAISRFQLLAAKRTAGRSTSANRPALPASLSARRPAAASVRRLAGFESTPSASIFTPPTDALRKGTGPARLATTTQTLRQRRQQRCKPPSN